MFAGGGVDRAAIVDTRTRPAAEHSRVQASQPQDTQDMLRPYQFDNECVQSKCKHANSCGKVENLSLFHLNMLRFILSDSVAPNQSILSRLAEKTDRSRDGVTLKTLALQGENSVDFFQEIF